MSRSETCLLPRVFLSKCLRDTELMCQCFPMLVISNNLLNWGQVDLCRLYCDWNEIWFRGIFVIESVVKARIRSDIIGVVTPYFIGNVLYHWCFFLNIAVKIWKKILFEIINSFIQALQLYTNICTMLLFFLFTFCLFPCLWASIYWKYLLIWVLWKYTRFVYR